MFNQRVLTICVVFRQCHQELCKIDSERYVLFRVLKPTVLVNKVLEGHNRSRKLLDKASTCLFENTQIFIQNG